MLKNTGVKVFNALMLSHSLDDFRSTYNSFSQPVMSEHGLLTTIAYKLGKDKPAYYALEVNVVVFFQVLSVCPWFKYKYHEDRSEK